MKKEITIWICLPVKDHKTPAIAWAQKAKCAGCNCEVWFDPLLPEFHPLLKDATKYCMDCGLSTVNNSKEEVSMRFPHREKPYAN